MPSLIKTKKTYLLLLCLIGLFKSSFSQTYSTGVVNLSSTNGLAMTAKIDVTNQVKLTLTGPVGRWFSVGFNATTMTSGTDVVSVHSATNLNAFDCSLSGFSAPNSDASQNWTINSDVVSGTVRTVIATRALNTGDANDYVFSASPTSISLIWARSSSATFSYSYHGGSNRGAVLANLALVPPPAAPTGSTSQTFCSGATTAQINATGTSIQWYANPSGGTALNNVALVNGSTYYATQTVNGVESTNRLAVTVTVNTIPASPASINGSTSFCFSNAELQYSVPPVSNATSYVWTLPNGATGSSTSNAINVLYNSNFQTGNLTVQAQNACGLSNPTTLGLTQHFSSTNTLNVTTCSSYVFNGQTYTQSGTYQYTGVNVWGCDSTVNLNLVISPSINETLNLETCESYNWNGQTFTSTGTYIDTFQTINGCDSIVTLNLTINPTISESLNVETCGTYLWNGQSFMTSGIYIDTFQTSNGCDSIVTLNLIVNPTISESLSVETCGSYPWNGESYTSSGIYIDTFQTSNGCDSIVTLNLIINPIYSIALDTTVDNSFVWNGTVYTTSGTYTQFFTSVNDCDSSFTINLEINTIDLESLQNDFVYYPNPIGEERILHLPNNSILCDYYLYDFKGMLVQKGAVQNILELNNNIKAGTYILSIHHEKILILVE
ncbi:MAG: hypothetical protein RL264_1367 [Bacteroidota bacterium]|jgi:hypothetical protein